MLWLMLEFCSRDAAQTLPALLCEFWATRPGLSQTFKYGPEIPPKELD